MPDYWIKIPTSILDDPKWGLLSDSDWRRKLQSLFDNPQNWHMGTATPEFRKEWQKRRYELTPMVFERDPNECKFCGSKDSLEIDHIIPLSRGGTNELSNLQILCRTCNRKKGARV